MSVHSSISLFVEDMGYANDQQCQVPSVKLDWECRWLGALEPTLFALYSDSALFLYSWWASSEVTESRAAVTKYLTSDNVVLILYKLTSGIYTSCSGGLDTWIQDYRRFSCRFTPFLKMSTNCVLL